MRKKETTNTKFSLQNRTIAVIGAASGIGEAVAIACAECGGNVIIADLDNEGLFRVAAEISSSEGECESHDLDICDENGVGEFLRDIDSRFGLDAVVATPALNIRQPITAYSSAEVDRIIDVNLKGGFYVLNIAGNLMSNRGKGSIVLFSSIRGKVVEAGQGIYAATKGAIEQLVRASSAELGPSGVRVNALAPGIVTTPLTQQIQSNPDWHKAYASHSVFNRWATPEEIAWPTVFLLSEAASFITGSVLYVDGGWTAIDGRFNPPSMETSR
ncbi:MAG: Cyclopentanol dehydrogenase [Candidatus Moanabacter tarae]|uniref:Cyclopentanol dehydrogenase n=1 Tax=Candidatus Moanibacter tarae TaxID=2200854 RepID=A0A2Z4ADX0_9BACT|nr:MAG: Cyclopentanol dehydrogenase [Candidatus Moanabacter tarae]|tara:strand:+ start:11051 stop:11866 length:816 start_codon:yes stop_codon:yes gene_type:complete